MYNGIVNIYKEKGFTSHDVVAKLRGILKQKKIGHTGTLDPDAEGVLPVCLGKGTKLCDMLTDKEKEYKAVMVLGKATDTQDISGSVIHEEDILSKRSELTDDVITDAICSFIGGYDQLPPMYSAIKVNGRKLYELAREGIEVERKTRHINIIYIEDIVIKYPEISMRVGCGKGTYIRTLCHDIGERLGTWGCMTSLQRTRSGIFDTETALTLAQVEKLSAEGLLDRYIASVDSVFEGYDSIYISQTDAASADDGYILKLLHNGNSIPLERLGCICGAEGSVRVYDENGEFAGLYRAENGMLKPEKLFF